MPITRITTASAEETRRAAATLCVRLRPGAVLALHGDLGAGKTCFVQGLAEALDCEGPVTSPTFSLLHEYPGAITLYHADLYRMENANEVQRAGLMEYLDAGGILAIEWAERAAPLLPADTIHIRFSAGAESESRIIEIEEPDA